MKKIRQITRIALLGALLYASQVALSAIPNIEVVTLLIVIFTKNLGKEGTLACFVYVFLTAITWGFGLWWLTYLVIWPLFSLIVYRLRKTDSWAVWAIINGAFGLCFGAVFALPYIVASPLYALNYWISGIPFDIAHCIGNFATALILGKALDTAFAKILKSTQK
ncbi:MAG: hypothetical protein NC340_03865 [Ruminococcus flavefaciens]|nr:hypothetical protein [Ruminococcus flavefaciens]MCM1229187.1 hypothetical protein [Ruminococcus flavefaciens]